MEHRAYASELRAEGRRLIGTVIRYGDRSPSHRERFAAGSLRFADTVHLDLAHDPQRAIAWSGGGGLTLRDGPEMLELTAQLPPIPAADAALAGIRDGSLRGLSVEFRALRARFVDGIRVIESAVLHGIGLVRNPSYAQSTVENRGRSGRTLRARMPFDTPLGCTCSGAECKFAEFSKTAMQGMMDEAFSRFEEDAAKGPIAAFNDYSKPLASVARGTLRGHVDAGDGVIEIDIPNGAHGASLLAAHEDAGIVARPFLRADQSVGEKDGDVMRYSKATMRAVIVSATDERANWPEPELIDTEPVQRAAKRIRHWL